MNDVNMIDLSTVTSWLHTDFDIFLGVAIGAADPTSLAIFEHYFERFQTTSEVSRLFGARLLFLLFYLIFIIVMDRLGLFLTWPTGHGATEQCTTRDGIQTWVSMG